MGRQNELFQGIDEEFVLDKIKARLLKRRS